MAEREVSVPHTRVSYITVAGPSAGAEPIWTRLSIHPEVISDGEFDNKNETRTRSVLKLHGQTPGTDYSYHLHTACY